MAKATHAEAVNRLISEGRVKEAADLLNANERSQLERSKGGAVIRVTDTMAAAEILVSVRPAEGARETNRSRRPNLRFPRMWDGRTDREKVSPRVSKAANTRRILRLPFGFGLRLMVESWHLNSSRTYQLAMLRFDHFSKCPNCSPTSGSRRDPWRMLFVVTWGRQGLITGRPYLRVLLPWRSDGHGRQWIVADGSREIRVWG